ncbi:MAG TPA: ribosomal L7Ae/L30e/S12e/Gadd45 family protein [Selenomonadales bacterium]|mgnify:CR=1 FL=1|nr:ribosomal L7Ae/L30e/S12e/Gadd45 family protein [Selenomonadales bacterium]
MPIDTWKNAKKVAGAKQVVKAVEKGRASLVVLAGNADARVTGPIRELCVKCGVAVETVPSMEELGKACGIEVGAAAVAILKV